MFDFEKCIIGLEELCHSFGDMTFSQKLDLEKKLVVHFGHITELYYKISDIEKSTVEDVIAYVETDGQELYWDTFKRRVRYDDSEIAISDDLASAVVTLFDDTEDF